MIDNSASMGDKQALLAQAVPDMITRLVTPNCIDNTGTIQGQADAMGVCANGKPEFPPVHDMHIGIISSSLGGRGGDECPPVFPNPANPSLDSHNDDQAHLIHRGGDDEHNVAKASQNNFLAWFPPGANQGKTPPANPETTPGARGMPGTLIGDFTDMIAGVHEHGCGFEAQNEAWYRFLVQPDPFDKIVKNGRRASLQGLDQVVLAQRAAFLRPDSLLAVIVVTDENEEVANPLAVGGQAWLYENSVWPGQSGAGGLGAPEGTIECQTNPNDANCTSCAFSSVQNSSSFMTRCPNDNNTVGMESPGTGGFLTRSDDGINVRFFHQKQRFGVYAGYPLSRYIRGLTQPTVPDRSHEVDGNGNYVGDQPQFANCVNPIFANDLSGTVGVSDPTSSKLCGLTPGPRTPDLVYYAAIVGVPHQLLQSQPGDPNCPMGTNAQDCPQKDVFSEADWKLMTGADAENYDFTGADFHMLESIGPRAQSACPPGSNDDCDAINGREYDTQKSNLQFSCIFPLTTPKDCTSMAFTQACDCLAPSVSQNSALCQKNGATYGTTQIKGKAYPSVREVELAHAMAGQASGVQGIVSSLCPIHTSAQGPSDPLFGYRPAVNAIVNRLKNALQVQCLPQTLTVDQTTGEVPCLILVTLPPDPMRLEQVCNTIDGLQIPPQDILQRFQDTAIAAYNAAGGMKSGLTDPRTQPVCQIKQIGQNNMDYQNCATGNQSAPGWCYVSGQAAGSCPQQILFTANQPPRGGAVSLQCIEQTNAVIDGGK
ncbi:MAG: hypothetical protein JOZ69_21640 [Myxococcales bacterium]|nr:hypothetical protein [Myxococcales bacterium]